MKIKKLIDGRSLSMSFVIILYILRDMELIIMSEIERKILKRFMYTSVPWVVVKLMVLMEERRAKRKKV